MSEDREIFMDLVAAAKNHLVRSEEGRRLLQEGRSLKEMTTPLTGLTDEQTKRRRAGFVKWLKRMDDDKLNFVFQNTMHLLRHRWADPDKGTSELELRRILFEDEFERRGIEIPGLIDQNKQAEL